MREELLRDAGALPSLLNQLPGADGRRWMVFPYRFYSRGVEFRISMRVALGPNPGAVRLAVDICGEKRRWRFILDGSGEGPAEVRVSLSPPPADASLVEELRALLGESWAAAVRFTGEEPWYADSRDDVLLSINEEV
jgi:hypothetical protein